MSWIKRGGASEDQWDYGLTLLDGGVGKVYAHEYEEFLRVYAAEIDARYSHAWSICELLSPDKSLTNDDMVRLYFEIDVEVDVAAVRKQGVQQHIVSPFNHVNGTLVKGFRNSFIMKLLGYIDKELRKCPLVSAATTASSSLNLECYVCVPHDVATRQPVKKSANKYGYHVYYPNVMISLPALAELTQKLAESMAVWMPSGKWGLAKSNGDNHHHDKPRQQQQKHKEDTATVINQRNLAVWHQVLDASQLHAHGSCRLPGSQKFSRDGGLAKTCYLPAWACSADGTKIRHLDPRALGDVIDKVVLWPLGGGVVHGSHVIRMNGNGGGSDNGNGSGSGGTAASAYIQSGKSRGALGPVALRVINTAIRGLSRKGRWKDWETQSCKITKSKSDSNRRWLTIEPKPSKKLAASWQCCNKSTALGYDASHNGNRVYFVLDSRPDYFSPGFFSFRQKCYSTKTTCCTWEPDPKTKEMVRHPKYSQFWLDAKQAQAIWACVS